MIEGWVEISQLEKKALEELGRPVHSEWIDAPKSSVSDSRYNAGIWDGVRFQHFFADPEDAKVARTLVACEVELPGADAHEIHAEIQLKVPVNFVTMTFTIDGEKKEG
jgi:hypothetical protein